MRHHFHLSADSISGIGRDASTETGKKQSTSNNQLKTKNDPLTDRFQLTVDCFFSRTTQNVEQDKVSSPSQKDENIKIISHTHVELLAQQHPIQHQDV